MQGLLAILFNMKTICKKFNRNLKRNRDFVSLIREILDLIDFNRNIFSYYNKVKLVIPGTRLLGVQGYHLQYSTYGGAVRHFNKRVEPVRPYIIQKIKIK